MACRIIRRELTNEIVEVFAENGEPSILYNDIKKDLGDAEAALVEYMKMTTPKIEVGAAELFESDFKSQIERYIAINNLFNENPSLANSVYEALGFNNQKDKVRLYRIENKNIPYDESREGIVSKKEIVGGFFTDNIDTVSNYIRKNQSQEGINLVYVDISKNDLDKYHVSKNEYAKTMDVESDNWIIPSDINRSYVDLSSLSKVTGNFMTLSKAKQELKSIVNNLPISQITPQQKQQATFMFSEFLDVYLQDFEQVEKILKEEKIIDKKCS